MGQSCDPAAIAFASSVLLDPVGHVDRRAAVGQRRGDHGRPEFLRSGLDVVDVDDRLLGQEDEDEHDHADGDRGISQVSGVH